MNSFQLESFSWTPAENKNPVSFYLFNDNNCAVYSSALCGRSESRRTLRYLRGRARLCLRAALRCAARSSDTRRAAAEFGSGCTGALAIPSHQLLLSCGRQSVGVAASLQTARAEAGRCTHHPPPPSLPPRASSVLPAGSPCSNTMVDRIKVTFLAVTVADNLSHEFNMV